MLDNRRKNLRSVSSAINARKQRKLTSTEREDSYISGTKIGGIKAAQTNKRLYGDDFFQKIGSRGGKATGYKGFAADRNRAVEAGRKAGKLSKRGHRYLKTSYGYNYYTKIDTGETVRYKA